MSSSTNTLNCYKILIASIVILELGIVQECPYAFASKIEGLRQRTRMHSARIAQNARGSSKSVRSDSSYSEKADYGKYEIRSVSGEPDYKSVNLTWEVEFVPSRNDAAERMNSSNLVEDSLPPKVFQIFYCELQSFGPHRCRSKLVNESAVNNAENAMATNRQSRHFSAQIDNLRMATKYSFHIRPQAKFGRMKISARSGVFDNEIDEELNYKEQGIVIPTKGFSAEATKCLPHASEIEVETGPHFAGKIVVDGGNCGVKGNPQDPKDKYTMRIDHKKCGSLVKPETNTVETFITVQENLGIFTHSTRRFVVVCSFQSGMQTVRASFMVPGGSGGGDGMAAAMDNDPFQPDERETRLGREQRHMRYVDKSALVLKENNNKKDESEELSQSVDQHDEVARVKEVADPAKILDAANSVAMLENILSDINEGDIKHESNTIQHNRRDVSRSAKYAKLILDPSEVPGQQENAAENNETARAYVTTLHYIASNVGSIMLTVSVTVIIIGVFIFIVCREVQRRRSVVTRQNLKLQSNKQQSQLHQQHQQHKNHQAVHGTRPISVQIQQPTGTM